jgi:ribosomal protein S18 acetylase RimI-like enzyme
MGYEVREATAQEITHQLTNISPSDIELGLMIIDESGAAAFRAEPFDSQHLGFRIGRMTGLSAANAAGYDGLIAALLNRTGAAGYRQILRRTGLECREEIWALGRHGFELMDVGVVFGCTFRSIREAPPATDLAIRQATDSDVAAVVAQMLEQPWDSRYEADPTYSLERVRALRSTWLWNSHRGRAAMFLVGVIDGAPAGYVTCLLDAAAERGEIELVGTLPAYRGRRVASRVLEHALAWFSSRVSLVTVRTQATNYAAAALYEKSGFTLHASDVTFRYKFPPTEGTI